MVLQAAAPLALVQLAGPGAAAAAAVVLAWVLRRQQHAPTVHGQQGTPWNSAVLELCPSLAAPYTLPRVLNNGHVETIVAAAFRQRPHILYDRELLALPDGGCVALDTEDLPAAERLPDDAPVLLLLPGLTGGSEDTYVQHAVLRARQAGMRAVVFNSRGTSGSPVLTAQFYSASHTEDLRNVVAHVRARHPRSQLFAAGWSLGANILTRYLGEEGEAAPLAAAAALANPLDLLLSRAAMRTGFSKVYTRNLARSLVRHLAAHAHLFEAEAAAGGRPYRVADALAATTIGQYDDAITTVSFGWPDVMTYYEQSGSVESIPRVRIPLLCIQAADDPIAPHAAIPYKAIQANPHCLLVVTPTGGHLGWCGGPGGVTGAPWPNEGLTEFFTAVRSLLNQPRFAAEAAAEAARQQAAAPPAEPAGVFTLREEVHQAP
ncbi:Embryogenesis-associated EMB8 [Micractinium conductrix]|uniref:Embryogenesis-associated EMB8 n=1 Tax=Micractinium conductrix TaxID=554055 RepID=A0A2P6VRS7_9CHLO|nr:Embryogenesis-associated EMB8 [Micractinium conductrix]|eukprot:PSC76782.1 Embryogenesis-associated EMB8 [Micractinium conductrix]